jgi:hypothetical protein
LSRSATKAEAFYFNEKELLELGRMTYDTVSTEVVHLVFEKFTALPTDYIAIPQLYWIS